MMKRSSTVRMAIFASGGGSNARQIFHSVQDQEWGEVALMVTNNPQSGVIPFAQTHQIPLVKLDKSQIQDGTLLVDLMQRYEIELIILAGYLKLIPTALLQAFPDRILNIHPSLLPAYGGKGMYGMKVHEAVIAHDEAFSGITIQYVNERYDEGEIIFQAQLRVEPDWTPKDLQKAVQRLEHQYYAEIIEKVCYSLHNQ